MAKKKQEMTSEELLAEALVREEDWPHGVPGNWVWTYLTNGYAECLDKFRKPINATERADRNGDVPYYGATGQVGWIDDYLTNENLVLVGEDGAPFLDYLKDKAYIIDGKAWVNNHAHIIKSYYGEIGNKYIMHYLNVFNFKDFVNGTTRLKLTQSSLSIIPVPLPPLAEQQRIVDRIESLFDQLDQAKELIQEALDSFENRKAAILHQAFTGELTKKWRAGHGVGVESWEEKPFTKCAVSMQNGISKRSGKNGRETVVLRLANINGNSINEIDLRKILLDDSEIEKYKLEYDDILIVRVNGSVDNVGKLVRIKNNDNWTFCDHLIKVKVNLELISPALLLYFSMTYQYRDFIKNNMVSSAGQNTISQKSMGELLLPLPTLKEQNEIVRILDNLFEKEQSAKDLYDLIDQIEAMKKTILGQAFRGELGTNEAGEASAVALLKAILE